MQALTVIKALDKQNILLSTNLNIFTLHGQKRLFQEQFGCINAVCLVDHSFVVPTKA